MKGPQEYFYFLTLSLYFTEILQKQIELTHECYLSVRYNANRHFKQRPDNQRPDRICCDDFQDLTPVQVNMFKSIYMHGL